MEQTELTPVSQAPITVIVIGAASVVEFSDLQARLLPLFEGKSNTVEWTVVAPSLSDGALIDASSLYSVDSAAGWGPALQAALADTKSPLVLFISPRFFPTQEQINKSLEWIDKVHAVQGVRAFQPTPTWRKALDAVFATVSWVGLGLEIEPRLGWLGSRGWLRRKIARWMFGLRLSDPECIFKLVRRQVFDRIVLQSSSSFAMVELAAKANHVETVFTEIAVGWAPGPELPSDDPAFRADARRVFRSPSFSATPLLPFIPEWKQTPSTQAGGSAVVPLGTADGSTSDALSNLAPTSPPASGLPSPQNSESPTISLPSPSFPSEADNQQPSEPNPPE